MSIDLISKRYAKALFLAANKSKSLNEVSSSLNILSGVFKDMPNEIQRVFLDPTVCRKDLTLCVSSFLKGLPTVFSNFCNILVNEGRLSYIVDINIYFQKLLIDSKGQSKANVWSAYELTSDFCSKLEKILSNLFKKEVSLIFYVDPHLLGGIVVEMDGFRFDASISGNLNQLKYHMKGAR